jgi:GNAT superfamily N-acetyltransferase
VTTDIHLSVANNDELLAAQQFYESRGYGGAAIVPSDFVVLAKRQEKIVGIGRLCKEQELLWLRGMQVESHFQRQGIGTKILHELDQQIAGQWCCCLPYDHLTRFYQQVGFVQVKDDLPLALSFRLASYRSRGIKVIAMVKERSRPA